MVLRVAAIHHVKKRVLQLFGDWTAPARADPAVVDFADGRDFGGRAGEEGLVRDVDVVARQALGQHAQAQVGRQGVNGGAGDARQRRGDLGLAEHPVLDDEQVLAGAFGDKAVGVQQQGLVVAVLQGFGVGEDGVGVRGGDLGARHGDIHMLARERRHLHADAVGQRLFAQVRAPRPGRDGHVHPRALGRHAHFFGAVEHEGTQVAGFQLVFAHDHPLGFVDRVAIERHGDLVDVRRIEEPVGVVFEAEDGGAERGAIGAHAFEHGQPVVQRMRQDMRGRVSPWNELAVIPDETVAVSHRHGLLHTVRARPAAARQAPRGQES